MSTSNNNFYNTSDNYFKHLFKGLKLSFCSLLQSVLTQLSMFQVYKNILIFPMGKNAVRIFVAGIFPCRDFSQWGFFFCRVFILRNIIQWQIIFLHLFTFILYMVWIQLSSCMLKWRKPVFTLSQTQRQIFTLCCPYTCIYSKAAPIRATCLCHLFIHFANSLDPDQALHLRPDQDPNCLTLWWYSWICFGIVIKLILISANYT